MIPYLAKFEKSSKKFNSYEDRASDPVNEWNFFSLLHSIFPYLNLNEDAYTIPLLASPHDQWVVSTDMLVQGTHFDIIRDSYEEIGFKAVACNVSDIYAMGAVPVQFLLSIAIPKQQTLTELTALLNGIRSAADYFNLALVGGDTTSTHNGMVLSLTIYGQQHQSKLINRSGAKVGDAVYVLGTVGKSAATNYKISIHDLKQIKTEVLHDLIQQNMIHAMSDISDGIARSAYDISRASNVGLELTLDELNDTKAYGIEHVLQGGDDYALLLTIPKSSIVLPLSLHRIGRVVCQSGVWLKQGKTKKLLKKFGYNQF